MKKIILRLEGGLGNQLFQYAFARSIQKKYGGKILADIHTYSKDKQRDLSLNHFFLNDQVVLNVYKGLNIKFMFIIRVLSRLVQKLLSKIVKNRKTRFKLLSYLGIYIQEDSIYLNYVYKCKSPIIFIAGNWMSEHFFIDVRNDVRNDFEIITPIANKNIDILNQIQNTNSVCLHIRRGDYLDPVVKLKTFVCDFEYYEKAISLLTNELDKPVFYIFSNTSEDIQWIKDNYKFSIPVIYVDQNNPDYEDFRLMTNCKHFILSNSTYSWWVSYLALNPNKIVVSPSRWNNGIWDQKDIFIKSWRIINV